MAVDGEKVVAIEPRAQEPMEKTPPIGEKGELGFNWGSLMFGMGGANLDRIIAYELEDVPISKLLQMYRADGQIMGLFNLIKLPLVATDFHIEKFDRRSARERDMAEQTFMQPPHNGGMSTDMRYIKADMAMASVTKFRAYEKVYEIRNGWAVLRKLAPRNPTTIQIIQDRNGGFNGFVQNIRNPLPGQEGRITIERERALLYTNNKEDNPLYGRSDFLAAHWHYDKLHKLYYIAHMAFQAMVMPPRVGTAPAVSEKKDRDEFLLAIQRLGFDTALMLKEGWSVEPFVANQPGGANFMDLIEHHVGQMSKSVLASFMDLGSGKGRGSFALSKDLSSIWVMSIEAKIKDMDYHINSYVIPQMIDYNFNSRKYPKMVHEPLSGENKDALISVYTKLMASPSDHSSPEFLLSMEEELAKRLKLNLDYESIKSARIADIAAQRAAAQAATTQKQQGAIKKLVDSLKMKDNGNVEMTDKTLTILEELWLERREEIEKELVRLGFTKDRTVALADTLQKDGEAVNAQ